MTEHQTGGQQGGPSVGLLRYGRDEPVPQRRLLRAGPLSATLENGDLRYIKLGDEEIVRRIYGAVRDANWGTIEPRFTAYEVEADDQAFVVRFTAEHVSGDVDFMWDGRIEGTSAGVITCAMEGVARRTFMRNRIGWCVLHPPDLAGLSVDVETPDGRVHGAFPDRISPHQPFVDMLAISHATLNGGEVTIRFSGDLFEMEDQRNWTDASYKTYSTPLRLPYPVEVRAGDRVTQSVTVQVRSGLTIEPSSMTSLGLEIRVGENPVGVLPPIGLTAAAHGQPLSDQELQRIAALRPAHLRLVLDLESGDWRARLARTAQEAAALGTALELEVIAGDQGEGLEDLAEQLHHGRPRLARILVFPRSDYVTTEPVLARARLALRDVGADVPVGGGSRAYFTELNRATLPLHLMDVVGYTINPQVHAFDNASLVETLATQATTVESARAIVGDRPIAVGPVTLRPRFNPNATGPEPPPAVGELPASVDHRQPSLFAAGWTVGSLRHLAAAGAASLTYYETTGWRGVMERRDHPLRVPSFHSQPGIIFPLYHVLADVADFIGSQLLPVETTDPLAVEALALRHAGRVRVLVASFVDEPRTVSLSLSNLAARCIRLLDETTAERATVDPDGFRQEVAPLAPEGETTDVRLLPFAVATIDGELAR